MARIIDITVPFRPDGPLWPGDPAPRVSLMKSMAGGYRCNVTRIETGVHFGTHLDAPCHFIEGGKGVDQLDLEALVGLCVVAEIPEVAEIAVPHLDALALPSGTERLLLKTRNSALWDDPAHRFVEGYTALTADAARWMVERGIRLVGIDYLSIQLFADPESTTHLVLLGAEVVVVEGLDLRAVRPGSYHLICLPLKLAGADGAPVRAILTEL